MCCTLERTVGSSCDAGDLPENKRLHGTAQARPVSRSRSTAARDRAQRPRSQNTFAPFMKSESE